LDYLIDVGVNESRNFRMKRRTKNKIQGRIHDIKYFTKLLIRTRNNLGINYF